MLIGKIHLEVINMDFSILLHDVYDNAAKQKIMF